MTDGATLPLSDEQRVEFERMGAQVQFPANHVIFWEGQPSRSVLIIRQGHVAVTQTSEDGSEVLLAIRGPGVVMGDEGALMGEVRSASVKALTEVSGSDVTAEDLLRFINDQHLWPQMYRTAVERRRESDTERALLAQLSVGSRLARLLIQLARDVGQQTDEGTVIGASLSQEDLASRVGASREAIALTLRRFRAEGLVSTGRRKMTLLDLDRLREIESGNLQ